MIYYYFYIILCHSCAPTQKSVTLSLPYLIRQSLKKPPPRSSRGMTVNGVLTRHTLELYYQVYSFCTQNILLLYAQNNLFVRKTFYFCTARIIFFYAQHFTFVRRTFCFCTVNIIFLDAKYFAIRRLG